MKSWKTTSGGIAQIIGALCSIFNRYKTVGIVTVEPLEMAAITGGLALIFARDNNVTSEAAGACAEPKKTKN